MAKDPALLWYFNDWMGGTATLSRHLKGCYMDLLSVQFNSGPLSLEEIKTVLGSDFGSSWPALQKKFTFENGLYFNERLQNEKSRRNSFVDSRIKSRSYGHTSRRMENINEDVNEISIYTPQFEAKKFFLMFEKKEETPFIEYMHQETEIPDEILRSELKKFINYWTEKNKSGTKCRWEIERTFEVKRRLANWLSNASQWSKEKTLSKTKQFVI